MRLFIVLALICAIIGLVCAAVPTAVLGAGWTIWFLASFVAFLLDLLYPYVVPVNGSRNAAVRRTPATQQPVQ
jgi:hypothetical protein